MTYADYNIKVKKSSGEEATVCPKCSHTRKKKSDKCLSVNHDLSVWNCFHCGWSGKLKTKMEVKE